MQTAKVETRRNGEPDPNLRVMAPQSFCRMPGCHAPVPPKVLFCRACWKAIPNDLRVSFTAAIEKKKRMAAYERIMFWIKDAAK